MASGHEEQNRHEGEDIDIGDGEVIVIDFVMVWEFVIDSGNQCEVKGGVGVEIIGQVIEFFGDVIGKVIDHVVDFFGD